MSGRGQQSPSHPIGLPAKAGLRLGGDAVIGNVLHPIGLPAKAGLRPDAAITSKSIILSDWLAS